MVGPQCMMQKVSAFASLLNYVAFLDIMMTRPFKEFKELDFCILFFIVTPLIADPLVLQGRVKLLLLLLPEKFIFSWINNNDNLF